MLRCCLAVSLALAAGGCLADVPTSVVRDPVFVLGAKGLWLFHLQGGRFADRIQLLSISAESDTGPLRMAALPTRRWDGSEDLGLRAETSSVRVVDGIMVWTLALAGTDTVTIKYPIAQDTVSGTWQEGAGPSAGMVGVRLTALPAKVSDRWGPMAEEDTTPIVLIRIDDNQPTDPDFESRMIRRGLYGEVAVPTAYVGRGQRPSWSDLGELSRSGFVSVAHSRVHGDAPAADEAFIGEVLGSIADLAAHNLATSVFVQPGTWQDSLDFTSPASFKNWRGALFQTFTRNVEAYAYAVPRPWPLDDSLRLGLGHYTVSDGATMQSILYAWTLARVPRRCTVFLVHTLNLPNPSALDWFLDTLANARNAGRVRLAHSSASLYPMGQ